MGYAACENAEKGNYRDGNFGAGTGATVGKFYGPEFCMKSGIGSYAVQIGELQVGALWRINALGDIYDWKNGKKVAGLLAKDKKSFLCTEDEVYKSYEVVKNKFVANTTIGAVITNAAFHKTQLCKIASMTHNGYAAPSAPSIRRQMVTVSMPCPQGRWRRIWTWWVLWRLRSCRKPFSGLL